MLNMKQGTIDLLRLLVLLGEYALKANGKKDVKQVQYQVFRYRQIITRFPVLSCLVLRCDGRCMTSLLPVCA